MKYLFIGGCADHQWIEVPPNQSFIVVPKPPIQLLADHYNGIDTSSNIDTYELCVFVYEDYSIHFYKYTKMSMPDVVAMLFNFYGSSPTS